MYSGIKKISITDGTITVILNSIYPQTKVVKAPLETKDLNGTPIVVEMRASINITSLDVRAFAQLRKWMVEKTSITQIIFYGFEENIVWNEAVNVLSKILIPSGVRNRVAINIVAAKRGSSLNIVGL